MAEGAAVVNAEEIFHHAYHKKYKGGQQSYIRMFNTVIQSKPIVVTSWVEIQRVVAERFSDQFLEWRSEDKAIHPGDKWSGVSGIDLYAVAVVAGMKVRTLRRLATFTKKSKKEKE